ncbi:MAG: hypothetical protein GY757_06845 [bacterium]|nr:hypothetical protein [bacterium]
MKEGLETLYTLQQHDDRILEIENLIKEIPKEVKALEDERDGKASIIENTKTKLNGNVKKREKFEKDVLLIKEKINKYKEQMNKATTNKEYQGFIAEIKYEEENITGVEEKIIEQMLESDEIMAEIRKSEDEFQKIVSDYNQKIKDLTANLNYQKTKRSEELEERAKIKAEVPAKLLKIYDNLVKKKNGKAISYVETEFCGICHVKIRPQRLNELIGGNGLFVCENCGRVLFKKVEDEEEQN